jgi:hypothetical protein
MAKIVQGRVKNVESPSNCRAATIDLDRVWLRRFSGAIYGKELVAMFVERIEGVRTMLPFG